MKSESPQNQLGKKNVYAMLKIDFLTHTVLRLKMKPASMALCREVRRMYSTEA